MNPTISKVSELLCDWAERLDQLHAKRVQFIEWNDYLAADMTSVGIEQLETCIDELTKALEKADK